MPPFGKIGRRAGARPLPIVMRVLVPANCQAEAAHQFIRRVGQWFGCVLRFAGLRGNAKPGPTQSCSRISPSRTAVRATVRSVFAIKLASESPATPNDQIALNFDPQSLTETDLLYFPPDLTGSGIPLTRGDFELEYASVIDAAASLDALYFRAILDRTPDSETGVTPILKGYTLRLSY